MSTAPAPMKILSQRAMRGLDMEMRSRTDSAPKCRSSLLFRWSGLLAIFSAAFAGQPYVQRGALDPAFEKIPFDRWLGESDQAPFRWTASVPRAELSFHQRLVARVEIRLDGRDLESRRGNGK